MNILIVGGGIKVDFLLKSLLLKKHKVRVIHDNYEYCKVLSSKYDVPVIYGDGSKAYILEEAQIKTVDIVIAMTPKDSDNLVICQLAKKNYGVKRTFATVENPKNVDILKNLGIDTVVSATYVVSNIIEQMATVEDVSNFIPLEDGKIVLIEIIVKKEYFVCGKTIEETGFPDDSIISFIIRGVNSIIPNGNTSILQGDKLIVLSAPNAQKNVIKLIVGRD